MIEDILERRPIGADSRSTRAPGGVGPRERLLESALRIFSERGIQAAGVREITEAAGANIAAVNYYFGSKNGLVRAVLERYVRPIIEARNRALDDLQKRGSRSALRDVAQCLVDPMVFLSRDQWGGRSVILLLLQTRTFPTAELQEMAADLFDPISHRFVAAFRESNPKLSVEAAYWRYNFALGAIMQVLTDTNPATRRIERLSAGACRADDKVIAVQLVDFICAGMSAPCSREQAPRAPSHRR